MLDRIRRFISRMQYKLANWLLRPFNLVIVSKTGFDSVRYCHMQMAMYVERSGHLPNRYKARRNLRTYLQAQDRAIANAILLNEDPVRLAEMPPELLGLARILQEADYARAAGASDYGIRLAESDIEGGQKAVQLALDKTAT